jgi:FkbM family methyltransferase
VLNSLLIRYCRLMPFHFARWRIERYLHRHLSGTTLTRAKDGFQLQVDNADFLQRTIHITGTWDEDVASAIRARLNSNGVFLDVGANIGFFSLLAASRGAKVIAIEPNPRCQEALKANFARNGLEVELHGVAAGAADGTATLFVNQKDNVGAGTLTGPADGSVKQYEVSLTTLDQIVANRSVDLIKIDIEGFEVDALRGAARTLARKPAVICEVSEYSLTKAGSSKDKLFELMRNHGYEATILSPIRRSNSSKGDVHFQYDVIFESPENSNVVRGEQAVDISAGHAN